MAHRVCAGLALIWLLPAAAGGATSGTMAAIVEAFDRADLPLAVERLAAYERERGETAESLYLRGRIAILRGDLESARALAGACVTRSPDGSLCHELNGEAGLTQLLLRGNALGKIGAARRARRALNRAVALDASNLRARLMLVRYYALAPWFLGGSDKQARRHVEECAARDPAWGHEAAGIYALAQGNTAHAVERFAEAAALRPHARDLTVSLANAYLADDQPEAAIDTLQSLVERYPKFLDAWLELGTIAADRGVRSLRGTAALEHYLAHADDVSAMQQARAATDLSRLYRAAGRTSDAIAALRRIDAAGSRYRPARKLWRELCRSDRQLCDGDAAPGSAAH